MNKCTDLNQVFNSYYLGNLYKIDENELKNWFNICIVSFPMDTDSRRKADFIAQAVLQRLSHIQNELLSNQMQALAKASENQIQQIGALIKVSENQLEQSKTLTKVAESIAEQTVALRTVAEGQTELAKSMADDSKVNRKLAQILVALTVVLTIFTFVAVVPTFIEWVQKLVK